VTERVVDHENDVARMHEIERYGLLSAVPRPELTALADLAARVCGVSSAFISVITDAELLQLASVGFEGFTVPRALSMCDAVLGEDEPLISADLTRDPRFRDNPFVQQGRTIFYASYQLKTPSGVPFGSLCVFDDQEREIDESQRRALRDLSHRIVDVLELELRNQELASTVHELERSNLQLAAFAGQVSHDLRNPLGAVSGTLEMLSGLTETADPDIDTMRLLLTRAHRSTTRMARLVEEVLQFAALGGHLDQHPVDVHRLVHDVRDDLDVDLSGAKVEIGELADVVADPVQLRIVVQNLLSNAVKYSDPGGVPVIEVSAQATERTWRFEVVDHGRGLALEDRARVFDPFVRVTHGDGDPAAAVPGTGMGLATCRRIIQAHRGQIGLEATPGGGTTAWIELPVHCPDE
jgi:signal transduction histidine kinase